MGGFDAIQFDFLSWEEREELNKGRRKGHCWKKTPESSSGFRTGWSQGTERGSALHLTPERGHVFRNAREKEENVRGRGDEGSWKAFIKHLPSLFLKQSEVRGAGRGYQLICKCLHRLLPPSLLQCQRQRRELTHIACQPFR